MRIPVHLKEWREASAAEWIERYQEKIANSGFFYEKFNSGSLYGYSEKYDYSCIYRFVNPFEKVGSYNQTVEDKLLVVGKDAGSIEMAEGHASIAIIQRLFDMDAIPIRDVFEGINFLPYECFGENDDPVNVDIESAIKHNAKIEEQNQGIDPESAEYKITNWEPTESKSTLHRFGTLHGVPVKATIVNVRQPGISERPRRGVRHEQEYSVTYNFCYEMRRYEVTSTGIRGDRTRPNLVISSKFLSFENQLKIKARTIIKQRYDLNPP